MTSPLPKLPSSRMVLIVDDEIDVRELVGEILKSTGITPLFAKDGADAIDQLNRQQGQIDLILTDVMMPVVDGPTLARRAARDWPEVPVIFMTGYPADTLFALGLLPLEIPRIEKPFTVRQLVAAVREALRKERDSGN